MNDVAKHPRLVWRKECRTAYFRAKIPTDLQAHFGKREVKYSLKTHDPKEALERVRLESVKLDQEFAQVRRKLTAPALETLSDLEIERLAALHRHALLKADEEMRVRGLTPELQAMVELGAEEFEDRFRDALATGSTKAIAPHVEDVLEEAGIRLEPGSEAYRKLAHALTKATVLALEGVKARQAGKVVDTPPAPAASSAPDVDDLPLSGLFQRWTEEHRLAGKPEKTVLEFRTVIRRFIELHGDLPVRSITKAHVRDFKDALLRIPAVARSHGNPPTMQALLKMAEKTPDLPRLSARTVNTKALGALTAVLGYAVHNGYRDDNPASGIKAAASKVAKDARLPFDLADLNLIFGLPVFTQGERPRAGGGEAAKWLPLLALFTGARLEELGQLRVSDVKEETGVPFLDLSVVEEGKRLKTKSSRRKIPLHPQIVALGFLGYVEEQRAKGADRVFPLLRSSLEKVTAAWSKWWGRYCRDHGLTDRRKVFHSFRHTVKDGLRNNGVSKDLRDALMGHASGDVGDSYGTGFTLPVLAAAMAKLDYPGLTLTGS